MKAAYKPSIRSKQPRSTTSVLLSLAALVLCLSGRQAAGHRALQQATATGCRRAVPGCATDVCSIREIGSQAWICPRCAGRLYQRTSDGTRCGASCQQRAEQGAAAV